MRGSIQLWTVLAALARSPAGGASLDELAARSGWSRFHFHRTFRKVVAETPKQYGLRLRLEHAAAALLASDDTILAVSRAAGFRSHEVFTRAFCRHFGRTPRQYRAGRRQSTSKQALGRHRHYAARSGPCIRLFHLPVHHVPRRAAMPLLSIERKEIASLPFLYVRRQAARSEIAQTLAECFGIVFSHAMKAGLTLAGFPLARYPAAGPGLVTIEAGVPLAEPAAPAGEMHYCELPGGPVAFAIHGGAYDGLADTHAAIERWMQEQGVRAAGPPWEWYVTDPAQHPDPNEWRTHVYYPLAHDGAAA